LIPFLPSLVVTILIFLVIFANEFPDFEADKAVNKRTLVVTLGMKKASILYKAFLIVIYILLNIFGVINANSSRIIFPLLIMPFIIIALQCFRMANPVKLSQKGYVDLSKVTIFMHTVICIALIAAILLTKSV